jgi:hypothetical protein
MVRPTHIGTTSSNPDSSSSNVLLTNKNGATVSSTVMSQVESSNAMTIMSLASSITSPVPSMPLGFTQADNSPFRGPFRPYQLPHNPLFGMSTTVMASLQMFQHTEPKTFTPSRITPQALTNTSMASLRQQMDESNHEMVNMLTTQIDTVFNPLIQNTNESYLMTGISMVFLVVLLVVKRPTQTQIRRKTYKSIKKHQDKVHDGSCLLAKKTEEINL